jgi:hypothetical protein
MKALSKIAIFAVVLSVLTIPVFACEPCKAGYTEVNGKCQPNPTPPPAPTPTPVSTTNSNTNNNANNNVNTSSSNSASTASSNQSQGQSQNQSQGQQQVANGGTATATGGSSQSTVKDSGNSSNSNVNTAKGGQGGQGGAGGNAIAAANNNSSGNTTTFESSYKEAAATAMGYAAPPSATCIVTGGAGGQGIGFGFSISGGKEDKGCVILEAARNAAIYSNRKMYCIAILQHKVFKNATMEDCMQESTRTVQVIRTPEPVQVTPPTIIVPAPQVVIQTPAPSPTPVATNEGTLYNVGTCKFFNGRPTNVCYRMLDDAIRVLQNSASARLVLSGPMGAVRVLPYVDSKIARSRIELRLEDEAINNLTIATWDVR